MDLLIQEIGATASFNERPLQTLYFGGGTPSLIPPRQLEQIMRALDRRFGIAAGDVLACQPIFYPLRCLWELPAASTVSDGGAGGTCADAMH